MRRQCSSISSQRRLGSRSRSLALALSSVALWSCGASLLLSGCKGEPSAQEALKSIEEKRRAQQAAPAPKKASAAPAPSNKLKPPTEEELAAWDRKDPAGEMHLYKWDKRNLKRMQGYWYDLVCFRQEMVKQGDAFAAAPDNSGIGAWEQFKGGFIPFINRWQQRLFAVEPRILEKSKFISHFLEAHEIVMHRYPKAYNLGDKTELGKSGAFWTIVSGKITRYAEKLGGKWENPDFNDPKTAKKWAKRCKKAMVEPRKGKKRRRRRGP